MCFFSISGSSESLESMPLPTTVHSTGTHNVSMSGSSRGQTPFLDVDPMVQSVLAAKPLDFTSKEIKSIVVAKLMTSRHKGQDLAPLLREIFEGASRHQHYGLIESLMESPHFKMGVLSNPAWELLILKIIVRMPWNKRTTLASFIRQICTATIRLAQIEKRDEIAILRELVRAGCRNHSETVFYALAEHPKAQDPIFITEAIQVAFDHGCDGRFLIAFGPLLSSLPREAQLVISHQFAIRGNLAYYDHLNQLKIPFSEEDRISIDRLEKTMQLLLCARDVEQIEKIIKENSSARSLLCRRYHAYHLATTRYRNSEFDLAEQSLAHGGICAFDELSSDLLSLAEIFCYPRLFYGVRDELMTRTTTSEQRKEALEKMLIECVNYGHLNETLARETIEWIDRQADSLGIVLNRQPAYERAVLDNRVGVFFPLFRTAPLTDEAYVSLVTVAIRNGYGGATDRLLEIRNSAGSLEQYLLVELALDAGLHAIAELLIRKHHFAHSDDQVTELGRMKEYFTMADERRAKEGTAFREATVVSDERLSYYGGAPTQAAFKAQHRNRIDYVTYFLKYRVSARDEDKGTAAILRLFDHLSHWRHGVAVLFNHGQRDHYGQPRHDPMVTPLEDTYRRYFNKWKARMCKGDLMISGYQDHENIGGIVIPLTAIVDHVEGMNGFGVKGRKEGYVLFHTAPEHIEVLMKEGAKELWQAMARPANVASKLAQSHCLLAHAMPYLRGSASIVEIVQQGEWEALGLPPYKLQDGINLDLEAMLTPKTVFIEQYPHFSWEDPPIT